LLERFALLYLKSTDFNLKHKIMKKINGFAAMGAGAKLEKFQYELPNIGNEEVDVKVHYCGICHSDLSMINNEWSMSQYPIVPGHEIVGEVTAWEARLKALKLAIKLG
jgi:uncharacterized zinc-type alcohol dehydrogenase-like protein